MFSELMMTMFYVYAYCNPMKPLPTGIFRFEPFYIGKGSNRRMFDHLRDAKNNKPGKRLAHIRSLISSGITPEIVIVRDTLTEEEAFQLEISLIKQYGRIDLGSGCLLNFTDGGDGPKHSPEIYRRIGDKLRDRKATPETCQKISKSLKGKPRSEKAKANISTALKGRSHTDERKRSISIGMAKSCLNQQKKWLITTPETSFCVVSLDYLKENNITSLYSSYRSKRPITRGPLKGWALSLII